MLSPEEFDFDIISNTPILKRRSGNPGSKVKYKYKDIILAFDIETTMISDIKQSIMYAWQLQIGLEYTVIGRTWDEFRYFMQRLSNNLSEDERVVVYVHNLSFEFSYLQEICGIKNEDIFALDRRKPVKIVIFNKIELRCSAIQSNMTLEKLTSTMNVEHKKLSGKEFNYEKDRYSWTEMSIKENEYMVNDVLGLVESIKKRMDLFGDNLYTIPLTSTGYVRRDFKYVTANIYHNRMLPILPSEEVYIMLRESFRGGDVHANRYFSMNTIHNVKSYDRQSSYPDVLVNCRYPVSKFIEAESIDLNYIEKQINIRHKAVLMEVELKELKLKNIYEGCPYISLSKVRKYAKKDNNIIIDNGRIIECDYCVSTITDIDYKIIKDMYEFRIVILKAYLARYGKLPDEIRRLIMDYFRKKCELKNLIEKRKEAGINYDDIQLDYDKFKNLINSLYGLMAQNPLQIENIYLGLDSKCDNIECIHNTSCNDITKIWCNKSKKNTPIDILQLQSKSKSIPYQWGVWTCAHARYELYMGRKCIDCDCFVYCDTDSIKFISNFNEEIDKLNDKYIQRDIENNAYCIIDDKYYYLGVYEYEGEYELFKTFGSKKYMFIKNKKFKITISGVRSGEYESKQKLLVLAFLIAHLNINHGYIFYKNIEYLAFNSISIGYTFYDSAGLQAIYNDIIPDNCRSIDIDGKTINITSNLTLLPTSYTLGISSEYYELLTLLDI